jgi:hypothetical protein
MSTSVAGDFETPRPSHRGGAKKAVIVVAKLLVTGVLLADRGVGVGLLIVLGFVVLLLPSGLTALGGYRDVVLVVYGALIIAGALGLVLAPKIVSPLARWRYSRCFATLAADVHRVLLGSKGPVVLSLGCLIHAFTIVVVWLSDARRASRCRFRCDGLVHSHDRRGGRSDLDRRLGTARTRRGFAPCRLRRGAGKSIAVFSVLRPRAGSRLAAWSGGVAFVSIRARPGFGRSGGIGVPTRVSGFLARPSRSAAPK